MNTSTLEKAVDSTATTSRFYDALSENYDLMTNFEKRFVHERPFVHLLVQRYGIASALDAGCGTGFHTFLLKALGVEVTSVDVSQKMLDRLKEHARQRQTKVEVIRSGFLDLPDRLHHPYDAVFCLGNTLPHLLAQRELRLTLKNFYNALNPGGLLMVQLLNYVRILRKREKIQSVKRANGMTFIRFYEFHERSILFNLLTLREGEGNFSPTLESIPLKPLRKAELVQELSSAGFGEIRVHGSIALDDFQELESKDLVVLARRPEEGKKNDLREKN